MLVGRHTRGQGVLVKQYDFLRRTKAKSHRTHGVFVISLVALFSDVSAAQCDANHYMSQISLTCFPCGANAYASPGLIPACINILRCSNRGVLNHFKMYFELFLVLVPFPEIS